MRALRESFKVLRAGARFVPIPQRHVGSDNTVKVIENMTNYLEDKGVKVITRTEVVDVVKSGNVFKLERSAGEFTARYVILALYPCYPAMLIKRIRELVKIYLRTKLNLDVLGLNHRH